MAVQLIKRDVGPIYGADPEIFITLGGKVVGSEHLIPEDGLNSQLRDSAHSLSGPNKIVRDGVQVELNLPPTPCRAWLSTEIHYAFSALRQRLAEMELEGKKFEVSFREVVEVDNAELQALSKASRTLGCAVSYNWYDPAATINVDPETYTIRSAGGHLHLGLPPELMPDRARLAPILDVVLGNTSVLIDRDPLAAERRKVYGRAGEFRLPRHGFEYRTLSNFWLRSGRLVGLVTGLAKLGVWILDTAVSEEWPADQVLIDLVPLAAVKEAINTNNLALAKENFKGFAEFLRRHAPGPYDAGLDASKLDQFEKFIAGIDKCGLEMWFPEEPMEHWKRAPAYGPGWERFLDEGVR